MDLHNDDHQISKLGIYKQIIGHCEDKPQGNAIPFPQYREVFINVPHIDGQPLEVNEGP